MSASYLCRGCGQPLVSEPDGDGFRWTADGQGGDLCPSPEFPDGHEPDFDRPCPPPEPPPTRTLDEGASEVLDGLVERDLAYRTDNGAGGLTPDGVAVLADLLVVAAAQSAGDGQSPAAMVFHQSSQAALAALVASIVESAERDDAAQHRRYAVSALRRANQRVQRLQRQGSV